MVFLCFADFLFSGNCPQIFFRFTIFTPFLTRYCHHYDHYDELEWSLCQTSLAKHHHQSRNNDCNGNGRSWRLIKSLFFIVFHVLHVYKTAFFQGGFYLGGKTVGVNKELKQIRGEKVLEKNYQRDKQDSMQVEGQESCCCASCCPNLRSNTFRVCCLWLWICSCVQIVNCRKPKSYVKG